MWIKDPSYYHTHPSTAENDAEVNISATKKDYREAVSKGIKPSQSLIIGLSKKHHMQHGEWLLWIHEDCIARVRTITSKSQLVLNKLQPYCHCQIDGL